MTTQPITDSNESQASNQASGSTAKFLSDKQHHRRWRWEWNLRLLWISLVAVLFLGTAATISYRYHSNQTAQTLLARADAAQDSGNFEGQAKWLRRYSLLRPNDVDAIVNAALASDEAVETAGDAELFEKIGNARKFLTVAIGRLGVDRDGNALFPEKTVELRKRLIVRLLQLGGVWNREAERQVVLLDAEENDPTAIKWLAQALVGQVLDGLYQSKRSNSFDKNTAYWEWLSHQPPGDVLIEAVGKNPADIILLATLVDTIDSRFEVFKLSETGSSVTKAEILKRVAPKIKGLEPLPGSQAALVRYRFESLFGHEATALERLVEYAKRTQLQLEKKMGTADSQAAPLNKQKRTLITTSSTVQRSTEYWDAIVLAEVARQVSTNDPQLAIKLLESVTSLRLASIPEEVSENAYFSLGSLARSDGEYQRALSVWNEGLEDIDSNSLLLLGSVARLLVVNSDELRDEQKNASELISQSAETAVDRFKNAIDLAARRLANMPARALSESERLNLNIKITAARWRMNVLDAVLKAKGGDAQSAIELLSTVVTNRADVRTEERLGAARLLAVLYQQQGAWDLAAASLDNALELVPDDQQLRAEAAEAWTRSGDRVRANEHWRVVGNSASVPLQIGSLEAEFNNQLRRSALQRDFSSVRNAVARMLQDLDSESKTSSANRDPETEKAIHRLLVLKISIPPSGVTIETHLASPVLADSIASLAESNPQDHSLQMFAAEKLAGVGETVRSGKFLDRLEQLEGNSSAAVAIVRARIAAVAGDFEKAGDILMEAAKSFPQEQVNLCELAYSLAIQGGDPVRAYQALESIPEKLRTPETLFKTSQIAAKLPLDSAVLKNEQLTADQLADRWLSILREREGESGTYWRFIDASKLVKKLQDTYAKNGKFPPNDPDLLKAQDQVRELLFRRPLWGEAISLQGMLLAVQGRREQAIDKFQQGIAAGDRRASTRLVLWRQLVDMNNRWEDAEQVLLELKQSFDLGIDKRSAAQLGLIIKQGDYSRALDLARSEVEKGDQDYLARVLLAQTAITAAKAEQTSADQRSDLLDEADRAMDEAEELAKQDKLIIFRIRLAIHLARNDKAGTREEIARIESSSLDEMERLLLMSFGFVGIQDFKSALPLLIQADKIRPSFQTQLNLAQLYRQMQEPDLEIETLRNAHRINSADQNVKNRLIQALVTRDGKQVDFGEIEGLLQNSERNGDGDRLVYAAVLSTYGNEEKQNQAIAILHELIAEKNTRIEDATRLLTNILQGRYQVQKNDQQGSTSLEPLSDEIRSLYQSLVKRETPELLDLFRYADFLLNEDDPKDLDEVGRLLRQIEVARIGSTFALKIGIRYALKTKERDALPQIVKDWVKVAKVEGLREKREVDLIAGGALIDLDFVDQGLQVVDQGYRDDPVLLPKYIALLVRLGRMEQALEIATIHQQENHDLESATLLGEMMLRPDAKPFITSVHKTLVKAAVQSHQDSPALLESVATVAIQDQDFETAAAMYHSIDKLQPDRIRTLNNLAMAYSEIPGKESMGIPPAKRALEITREAPEVLDTYGVVLLRAGKPSEAEEQFRKAIEKVPHSHYQFHLILALLAQKRDSDAKAEWATFDASKLMPGSLTERELQVLGELSKKMGTAELP